MVIRGKNPYTANQREKFLDLFWQTYPELYEEVFRNGMSTSKVYRELEIMYPAQFTHVTRLWDYEEGYGA